MKKFILILFALIATILLVACGNDKTNENNETLDNRKFTQEMISELEEDVKGGTYELAVLISIENKYNVNAGNYEVTDCKLTDEYTYTAYGKIQIKGQDGKIKDKNIVVSYQLDNGEPAIASISLQFNEDGSSDYEDILAAEQESKKKAEEELASIEASKEAQRNEELERELAQLKLITDRIIEQSGYIDDGSHNYVAYNFDGNHFISDGNKCAYYIDENGEFVVHDYNEDEAFVPQCIFFDEDDEGNIIHELLPVDVNVENGFFQFNGINCDNIGSNTYKLGTEIYYGYNNKTEKMGGICAYTVINQYYIIISNDYKRYRNIYLLDTESYDVEFLLDNPIFDIVSWNIDEEGEGDIYIVDGEVVDEDTFWSVRNNILEVPEDCVLGVGNNIDLLIENIKDNYIIE